MADFESEPFILVIEGPVEQADQDHIHRFIGQQGLRAIALDPYQLQCMRTDGSLFSPLAQKEVISQRGYLFSDIIRPDDIVVKEHFEDLAGKGDSTKLNLIQAFHGAVDGLGVGSLTKYVYEMDGFKRSVSWEPRREPEPLAGIELVKRADIGFEPYSKKATETDPLYMAQYGMTAISLLRAIKWNTKRFPDKTSSALKQLSERLAQQLNLDPLTLPAPEQDGPTISEKSE